MPPRYQEAYHSQSIWHQIWYIGSNIFANKLITMRRDSIFYSLFKQSPALLFELLEEVPDTATRYRFESVAVKEPSFIIDGVFLPPESVLPGVVFFAEVQMQKDEQLYERLFSESMAYLYRNREHYSDWQAVVIYLSRSVEQKNSHPYRVLLGSDQVHRIYLNELGEIETLPLGVAAMVLTIVKESEAAEKARMLIGRANQEVVAMPLKQGIIDMVGTIMAYKFTNLSREEIDVMLGTKLEDVRVFREAKEEGAIGQAQSMVLRLLNRKVGPMPDATRIQIQRLTIGQLDVLSEALLDFGSLDDFTNWLEKQG
jgi:predicted transposase/invertase (TIGR01784 family)